MIFKKRHTTNLYNILLSLSRNKIFYAKMKLPDTFESRIYLMFIHFSIIMKIYKKKGEIFHQEIYDLFFNNIENDLRELGYGDVTVNKKMKDLNKILYDILLKLEKNESDQSFEINQSLLSTYFKDSNIDKSDKLTNLNEYFVTFYNFCFELPLENMLNRLNNFKI
jgi:cytochrome b pre-mRNA-processing protein 3